MRTWKKVVSNQLKLKLSWRHGKSENMGRLRPLVTEARKLFPHSILIPSLVKVLGISR